jgi:hypothetical protein
MARAALVVTLDYALCPPLRLDGTGPDGYQMSQYFEAWGYAVRSLGHGGVGGRPTKANFVHHLREIAATPGLEAVAIFYAGHGGQMPDDNGDEVDGMDETLVFENAKNPALSPTAGDHLRDDDLVELLRELYGGLDVDLALMIDACHSGTVCDLGFKLDYHGTWAPVPRGHVRGPAEKCRIVCVAACQDRQCAGETNEGGILTREFVKVSKGQPAELIQLAGALAHNLRGQQGQITASYVAAPGSKFGARLLEEAGGGRTRGGGAPRREGRAAPPLGQPGGGAAPPLGQGGVRRLIAARLRRRRPAY